MKERKYVTHSLEPIYDKDSKVLLLGTIPSSKSREVGSYYGHPKNRFWKVLADVFLEKCPETIPDQIQFLLLHKIALWDVLHSCTIEGSGDHSIRDIVVNDFSAILQESQIEVIFTTGKKADELYQAHCYLRTKIPSICLPSTSPLNCTVTYETLRNCYQQIEEAVKSDKK